MALGCQESIFREIGIRLKIFFFLAPYSDTHLTTKIFLTHYNLLNAFARAEAAEISTLWTRFTPDPLFTTVSTASPIWER